MAKIPGLEGLRQIFGARYTSEEAAKAAATRRTKRRLPSWPNNLAGYDKVRGFND